MRKKKKCFLFFDEFLEYVETMTDEECKQYMMALKAYREKGTMTQFEDRYMQSAFVKSVALIAESEEKYQDKCDRLRRNIEARKEKEAQQSQQSAQQEPQPEEKTSEKVEKKPKLPKLSEQRPPDYDYLSAVTEDPQKPEVLPTPTIPPPPPPTEPEKPRDPETLTYTAARNGDILVMNGKRVVKRTNGVFIIPTLDEVTDYVAEKGYHFSPKSFIEYYENSKPHPWCMANGNPVKAWKQCCTTFEQHIYLSEGKRAMTRQQSPSSHAHDDINSKNYGYPD